MKQSAELCQCFTAAKLQKLVTSKGCAQADNRLDNDPLVLAGSSNTGAAAQFHQTMGTEV